MSIEEDKDKEAKQYVCNKSESKINMTDKEQQDKEENIAGSLIHEMWVDSEGPMVAESQTTKDKDKEKLGSQDTMMVEVGREDMATVNLRGEGRRWKC